LGDEEHFWDDDRIMNPHLPGSVIALAGLAYSKSITLDVPRLIIFFTTNMDCPWFTGSFCFILIREVPENDSIEYFVGE
jgi:hypothetical protein